MGDVMASSKENNNLAGRPRELEQYLADLTHIKKLLDKNAEKPVLEFWAYLVWAGLVLAGTLLNFALSRTLDVSMHQAYFHIWLPIIFTGGIFETIAWVKKMSKDDSPLFTKRFVKFMLTGFSIIAVSLVALYYLLDPSLPVPAFILLFASLSFFLYAQVSYSTLYIEGAAVFAAGVLFVILQVSGTFGFLFAGIFIAVMLGVSGVHSRLIEKERDG
jgi:hypothetical protein